MRQNAFLVHQAMDNTQSDPVGAFSKGLLTGQQAQANAFNLQRAPIEAQQRDDAVERQKQLQNMGMIAAAAYSVNSPEDLERAKMSLSSAGIVPDDELASVTMDTLRGIVAQARGLEGQINDARDKRDYETGLQQWNATFAQRQRNSDRSYALRAQAAARAQQPQPGFRAATPEEAAAYGAKAGQINEENGRFYPINPPKGMKITSDGRGGFTMTEGPGVTGDTGRIQPSSTGYMIDSIDGILNDPALDSSTGILAPLQNVPGTDQRRFGARARQLEGQAFLQAFESLKGAGQITEIEGTKATQAIGRLDTYQSAEDYRAALTELRGILSEAQSRPQGWAWSEKPEPDGSDMPPAPEGVEPDLWKRMTPEERALWPN
jgi:hypothetical protein